MRKTLPVKVSVLLSALVCFAAVTISAQTVETKAVNFRYSQNPKTKTKTKTKSADPTAQAATVENKTQSEAFNQNAAAGNREPVSIARKTLEIAKRSSSAAVAPTEIYKIGIGDVLFINLKNAPKDATYYTVLSDGTIDYPLAGEMVTVVGITTDEIEQILREKIKLYENPQISVGVRDYASHTINVLGLVERGGEKRIQREAVPLYVVRAEALVQPKATHANIRRTNGATETINLKEAKSDEVLIFPGDLIEFAFTEIPTEIKNSQFFYIGGDIVSGGQKEFHTGLTLTQAIIVSGGLRKQSVKQVVIRRKNFQGLLEASSYNLKLIKDGKQLDPVLQAGDTIEVGF